MKTKALLVLSALYLGVHLASAQGTAFTYQGRLNSGANPANGSYDLKFTLYDADQPGGNHIAGPLTNSPTAVSNGLFTVALDFGSVFPGDDRWLEIAVRTSGGGGFTTLTPRQKLTPTPYAEYSAWAGSAYTAGTVSGAVPAASLTGTLLDARLSGNVARLNASQTFSGANNFLGNVGIGTTSPQAAFNVNGTARIDASPLLAYGEGLILNSPTDLGYGGIHFHNAARGGAIGAGTIKWSVFYNVTGEDHVGGNGLAFIQDNASTRLYLHANGNVGIGTTSPQTKLDVNGEIKASDKITAAKFETTGDIKARNIPGVEYAQGPDANTELPCGVASAVDSITINVPAAGFVFVSAFIYVETHDPVFSDLNFLLDFSLNSKGSVLTNAKIETRIPSGSNYQTPLHISWVIPVASVGPLALNTAIYAALDECFPVHLHAHNLTAVYLPVQY